MSEKRGVTETNDDSWYKYGDAAPEYFSSENSWSWIISEKPLKVGGAVSLEPALQ